MMEQNEAEIGIYYLICQNDRWVWDQRAELLSLNPERRDEAGGQDFIFRLKSFTLLEDNLRDLAAKKKLPFLEQALARLLREPADMEQRSLRHALGTLTFFVLCFVLRQRSRQSWLRGLAWRRRDRVKEFADLCRTTEEVLEWLSADGADSAWRDRYSRVLDYERRYQLVDMGRHALEEGRGREEVGTSLLNLSEHDLLVALWWSTRCQFELAMEWYQREGHHNPKARRALLDASGLYLRILKDEPRRQALEQFLDMTGTDPEREVKRVFHVRSGSRGRRLVAEDEAARRVFTDWFLRRYSILRAIGLELRPGMGRQIFWALVSLALGIGAICIFFGEGPTLPKILLQLLSLILIVALAPSLFRLMLPRALFGSLIAWLTIVLVQSYDAFPLDSIHKVDNLPGATTAGKTTGQVEETRSICHKWLVDPFSGRADWAKDLHLALARKQIAILESNGGRQGMKFSLPALLISRGAWSQRMVFVAVAFGILLVSWVFILNEVNRRILRKATWRSIFSLLVMVLGSLFWGVAFANPIRFLVEGGPRLEGCNCIWGIWILGSLVSVLFGILVQVLTEERALAAPLEEGA
jgi:hypothetical protein